MKCNEDFEWNLCPEYVTRADDLEKMMCWDRSNVFFVISLHPFNPDYQMVCPVRRKAKEYQVVLTSNEKSFGGDGEGTKVGDVIKCLRYDEIPEDQRKNLNGFEFCIMVWMKPRTAVILREILE